MPISIIVDDNILFAQETFGRLGNVISFPGRKITADTLGETLILVVRSVTRVDERLLSGSSVRFVGTATIGFDHVDLGYLSSRGIEFANAPASNSNSVAEYVIAALLECSAETGRPLEGSTLAIVGVGNAGSRVMAKAKALGMKCLLNDPPRQRQTGDPCFLPLDEALRGANFVTVHVPLEKAGPDATYGLANRRFFQTLKPGTVFVNTSRGDVVDEKCLMEALTEKQLSLAVLDVWQNEPWIDPQAIQKSFIATPHIAGFSFDGKVAAPLMIYEAVCRLLNKPIEVRIDDLLPPVPNSEIDLSHEAGSDEEFLRTAVTRVYDIHQDDMDLRHAVRSGEQLDVRFDQLRKHYRNRREFHNFRLILPGSRRNLMEKAAGLGFQVLPG